MKNVTFCYPNWTQPSAVVTPVYTGASWTDLSKLYGEVLSEMARCASLVLANSKFTIDLGTPRNINVLAIPFHNAQPGNKARITVATDAGFTDVVIDTGWKEFFGEVYPWGSLPWGHVSWIDGRLTAEQAVGRVDPWMHVQEADVLGRYVQVEFDFTGHTDGWVDCGQVVVSSGFSPTYNVTKGVQVPYYVDPSTKTRAKGGPQFADRRKPYRTTKMALDWLDASEAYGAFYEMVRDLGVTKPFFYIHNADADPAILPKQSFMATAEDITPPSHRFLHVYALQLSISESF